MLVLLSKVVAFYMPIIILKIGVSKLETPIKIILSCDNCGCQELVSDPLNKNLYKLLKKVVVWWSHRVESKLKTERYKA